MRLKYGVIQSDESGLVSEFREKPLLKDVWVSCGVYLFDRKTIERFPDMGSLENDIFPFIRLKVLKHPGFFLHLEY